MSENVPHVRVSVDLLKILPQLTNSRSVVFQCIALFAADPLGASKRDILDYTGLSHPTIDNALHFLERGELVYFTPETRRYRPNPNLVSFGKTEAHDLRELVPVIQGEFASIEDSDPEEHAAILPSARPSKNVKNFFTTPNNYYSSSLDDVQAPKEKEKTIIIGDAKTFLAEAGVFGSPLEALAKVVPADVAEEWAEWAKKQRAKDAEYGWGGIVVKALRSNPKSHPPGAKSKAQPRKAHISGALAHVAQKEEQ